MTPEGLTVATSPVAALQAPPAVASARGVVAPWQIAMAPRDGCRRRLHRQRGGGRTASRQGVYNIGRACGHTGYYARGCSPWLSRDAPAGTAAPGCRRRYRQTVPRSPGIHISVAPVMASGTGLTVTCFNGIAARGWYA